MNAFTETEVKPAIARSISHNEIARIESADPNATLEQIDNDENVNRPGLGGRERWRP